MDAGSNLDALSAVQANYLHDQQVFSELMRQEHQSSGGSANGLMQQMAVAGAAPVVPGPALRSDIVHMTDTPIGAASIAGTTGASAAALTSFDKERELYMQHQAQRLKHDELNLDQNLVAISGANLNELQLGASPTGGVSLTPQEAAYLDNSIEGELDHPNEKTLAYAKELESAAAAQAEQQQLLMAQTQGAGLTGVPFGGSPSTSLSALPPNQQAFVDPLAQSVTKIGSGLSNGGLLAQPEQSQLFGVEFATSGMTPLEPIADQALIDADMQAPMNEAPLSGLVEPMIEPFGGSVANGHLGTRMMEQQLQQQQHPFSQLPFPFQLMGRQVFPVEPVAPMETMSSSSEPSPALKRGLGLWESSSPIPQLQQTLALTGSRPIIVDSMKYETKALVNPLDGALEPSGLDKGQVLARLDSPAILERKIIYPRDQLGSVFA